MTAYWRVAGSHGVALIVCFSILALAGPAVAGPTAPGFEVTGIRAEGGEADDVARPRIGLALGGGAARGIAHIGVLRWFAEHRIPVDAVAGTSMGGLIGGAFATGLDPGALLELMTSTDWDLVFLADSPFKVKTFRRKEDARAFPSQLEFGLKGGFKVPAGLNAAQQVELLLDRIAAPYFAIDTFDDLPIPFRCVATDLIRSEAVVLDRGSLARAMRATMAIPGVFTPVPLGDRLFVDGGTLNNIPADVVRGMGADVVIAVNVGAKVEATPALQSMFAILGQTVDTMMTVGIRKALEDADLIVEPDLKGLTGMDWRRAGELADRGYDAAEAMKAELLPYALDEAAYADHLADIERRRRAGVPVPDYLRVDGVDDARLRRSVTARLVRHLGQPVDLAELSEDLLLVTGTDRFEYLTYRFDGTGGQAGLVVSAVPKAYGPPFLNLAFDLSNTDSTNFAATTRARLTTMDTFGSGSEVRVDLALGSDQNLNLEIYKTLGNSPVFVAPRLLFDRRQRNAYADNVLIAEYRSKRTGSGLDLGVELGARGELRVGFEVSDLRVRRRVGSPVLPEVEGRDRVGQVRWIYDGQTSPLVPTRGLKVTSTVQHYFAAAKVEQANREFIEEPDGLTQLDVEGSWFTRFGPRGRVFVIGAGGTSFGDEPVFKRFSLGGSLRLGAYNIDEVTGANYALATLGYLRETGRLPDVIGGNIFVGAWVENGSGFDRLADAKVRTNLSGGILLETVLGPMFFGGSTGFGGGGRFYVALGPFFE
jgi:NTE family protein